MVAQFITLPYALRIFVVFCAGVVAGGLVNWAAYALSSVPRPISPWSRDHPRDSGAHWPNRLPLVGWWRMRHKGKLLGYDFWIRPIVVELCCGLVLAGLYH